MILSSRLESQILAEFSIYFNSSQYGAYWVFPLPASVSILKFNTCDIYVYGNIFKGKIFMIYLFSVYVMPCIGYIVMGC